jgi:hypothetical protein
MELEVEILQPLNHDLVKYSVGQITRLPKEFAVSLSGLGVVRVLTPTELQPIEEDKEIAVEIESGKKSKGAKL